LKAVSKTTRKQNSNKLLSDYFNNRSQYIRIDKILSTICQVLLGVSQGSVLGLLLFLLFINDLSYFLKNFLTILFADDPTLGLDDYNYHDLLDKFNISIMNLFQWYYYNKMDTNWKKTEIMFIHNKKNITIPDFIMIY